MNLEQSLANVLKALQMDIAPQIKSGRAAASLRSVINIVGHLLINCSSPGPAAGDEISALLGAIGKDARPAGSTRLATNDEIVSEASVPYAEFGGRELYWEFRDALLERLCRRDAVVSKEISALISWEKRALERIAGRQSARLTARAISDAASTDRARIERMKLLELYLRGVYPNSPNLRVISYTPFEGGRSKITALIQLEGAIGLPAAVVFRQDAAVNTTGGPSVMGEFALMDRLHECGIRVPKPILMERSNIELGAPFVLMERLSGSVASGLLTPPYSKKVALMLAAELAKLHSLAWHHVSVSGLNSHVADRDALLLELEGFEKPWNTPYQPPSLAVQCALSWLRSNLDLALEGPSALIHGDPLFHNVLADGDVLTGLLDWEFAKVGRPAEDLGWIRAEVEGALPWDEFMSAYYAAGGPPLSNEQLDYYAVWESLRLVSMLAHSNYLAATGVTDDVEYTCVAFHETYIARLWLSTHLARVLSGA